MAEYTHVEFGVSCDPYGCRNQYLDRQEWVCEWAEDFLVAFTAVPASCATGCGGSLPDMYRYSSALQLFSVQHHYPDTDLRVWPIISLTCKS